MIRAILALAVFFCTIDSATVQSLIASETSALWHSPNITIEELLIESPDSEKLGNMAYDHHFMNTGTAPLWDFLLPLKPATSTVAQIKDGMVVFPASGRTVILEPETLPELASPAEPFVLGVPSVESVLIVEPYYMFRDKQTAYRVSTHRLDGTPGPRFDSLPTHRIQGVDNILVAPERAGCCENATWSIRFYDISAGNITEFDCPPGRCGDLVLARPKTNGPIVIAMEVFETKPGIGSAVETRLTVIASTGKTLASGRIAHATLNAKTGWTPDFTACASRVLVAKGSPYAVVNLTAVKELADGRWAFQFDTSDRAVVLVLDGVSLQEAPAFFFLSSNIDPSKG